MYLILNKEHFTFHLQYKHSGTFTNRKYEELSYPKNQKMCDPILITLLKTRIHYCQSSRENATPFSGVSPLASYREVHTSGLLHVVFRIKKEVLSRFFAGPSFQSKIRKVVSKYAHNSLTNASYLPAVDQRIKG